MRFLVLWQPSALQLGDPCRLTGSTLGVLWTWMGVNMGCVFLGNPRHTPGGISCCCGINVLSFNLGGP